MDKDKVREVLLARLQIAWEKVDELRLGQFITNAFNQKDFYYVTDEKFIKALEEYAETRGSK